MQKKTRSILDELTQIYDERNHQRDKRHIIESRAQHIIASAIRLLEQIDSEFSGDQADNLNRKFLNAIKQRDVSKFIRTMRRTDVD